MGKFEILDQLVEKGNGYLLTSDALTNGISKRTLGKYVAKKNMERVAHGIYLSEDAWPDDYFLISLRNNRAVFSMESALYLHGLMEREPLHTTVTVPRDYNATHIKKQGVRVIHSGQDLYSLGITRHILLHCGLERLNFQAVFRPDNIADRPFPIVNCNFISKGSLLPRNTQTIIS